MTAARPDFPALAETVSVRALAAVTAGEQGPDPFAALWEWLAAEPGPGSSGEPAADPAPVRRLFVGFDLPRPEQALVTLLFAAGTSELVVRAAAEALAATGGQAAAGCRSGWPAGRCRGFTRVCSRRRGP